MQERGPELRDELGEKIVKNIGLSARLGWDLTDFGAEEFDADLVRGIELFQIDRMIEPTGIADFGTYQALLAFKKALKTSAPDRERRANLRGLGSVSRLPEDHPRVLRSRAFTGRSVVIQGDADRPLLSRLIRGGSIDVVILHRDIPNFAALARSAYADGARVVAAVESLRGAKAAMPEDLAGVLVWVPDVEGLAFVRGAARAKRILRVLERHYPETKRALSISHRMPRTMAWPERYAWQSMLDLADVYMPRVPQDRFRGNAPEWWCGQCFAEWSVQMKQSCVARWIYPLYRNDRRDINHALRFRAYMRDRSIRGHGYTSLPRDAGHGPFFGPLPRYIRRIDDEPLATG